MRISGVVIDKITRTILSLAAFLVAVLSAAAAHAQTTTPGSGAQARVIVVGEGSVTVTPDYARITGGVTTNAKTVKEASDTNSKLMANIIAALVNAGIAKKDIQTTRFSIEPIYTSPSSKFSTDSSNGAPKLSGYRVSNRVNVTIHQISQVSDILDGLVKAGATDVGNVVFLFSEQDKALDQAREAAIANARHKAELYAQASGVNLGRVASIAESSEVVPFLAGSTIERAKLAPSPPIESGEETITARVTVGFDIAQ
jgi:uncharacterized protein